MKAWFWRTETRAWVWRTFVYDRMWQPGNIAQWAWVKMRGYPLPRWLIPPFRSEGERWGCHSSGSYWTPIGQLRDAWRLRRNGWDVRLKVGR